MKLLVNIDVADVATATSFYTQAFDLKVGRRFGAGAVELLGASVPFYLLQKEPGTSVSAASDDRRQYARHWTPVHIDVVVDDIDTALARALGAGASQESPVRSSAWGKLALLADPFGNGFCLVQFVGRGYDEIATN